MFIQTESTPNPATLKFLPGCNVMESGTANFTSQDEAKSSPLAINLFNMPGVTGVFLGADFITLTKTEDRDWDLLKPLVLGAIMEHFQSGKPVMTEASSSDGSQDAKEDDSVIRQIKDLIDTRVRRLWPKMAAILFIRVLTKALFICKCKAHALDVQAQPQLLSMVSRICCAIMFLKLKRFGRFN